MVHLMTAFAADRWDEPSWNLSAIFFPKRRPICYLVVGWRMAMPVFVSLSWQIHDPPCPFLSFTCSYSEVQCALHLPPIIWFLQWQLSCYYSFASCQKQQILQLQTGLTLPVKCVCNWKTVTTNLQ